MSGARGATLWAGRIIAVAAAMALAAGSAWRLRDQAGGIEAARATPTAMAVVAQVAGRDELAERAPASELCGGTAQWRRLPLPLRRVLAATANLVGESTSRRPEALGEILGFLPLVAAAVGAGLDVVVALMAPEGAALAVAVALVGRALITYHGGGRPVYQLDGLSPVLLLWSLTTLSLLTWARRPQSHTWPLATGFLVGLGLGVTPWWPLIWIQLLPTLGLWWWHRQIAGGRTLVIFAGAALLTSGAVLRHAPFYQLGSFEVSRPSVLHALIQCLAIGLVLSLASRRPPKRRPHRWIAASLAIALCMAAPALLAPLIPLPLASSRCDAETLAAAVQVWLAGHGVATGLIGLVLLWSVRSLGRRDRFGLAAGAAGVFALAVLLPLTGDVTPLVWPAALALGTALGPRLSRWRRGARVLALVSIVAWAAAVLAGDLRGPARGPVAGPSRDPVIQTLAERCRGIPGEVAEVAAPRGLWPVLIVHISCRPLWRRPAPTIEDLSDLRPQAGTRRYLLLAGTGRPRDEALPAALVPLAQSGAAPHWASQQVELYDILPRP